MTPKAVVCFCTKGHKVERMEFLELAWLVSVSVAKNGHFMTPDPTLSNPYWDSLYS